MAIVGLLTGFWFIAMGLYSMTHAERSPESPAGHWMSFPAGRRVGGALSILVGCAAAIAGLSLL